MYEKEGKQREGEEEKINLLAAAAKISSKDKRAKRERAVCLRRGCEGGAWYFAGLWGGAI